MKTRHRIRSPHPTRMERALARWTNEGGAPPSHQVPAPVPGAADTAIPPPARAPGAAPTA